MRGCTQINQGLVVFEERIDFYDVSFSAGVKLHSRIHAPKETAAGNGGGR
jgi:hypothetical protein